MKKRDILIIIFIVLLVIYSIAIVTIATNQPVPPGCSNTEFGGTVCLGI
ncbi:MAG: hypothetical protein HZB67_02205 [Candidatus Aenigmarchaeota archaeon]|nr:hypothetical protein [Candidatus Aenigmarchaeota archaeon]